MRQRSLSLPRRYDWDTAAGHCGWYLLVPLKEAEQQPPLLRAPACFFLPSRITGSWRELTTTLLSAAVCDCHGLSLIRGALGSRAKSCWPSETCTSAAPPP